MYIGLGQVVGGYNPCGQGYDFLNYQCVKDSNCDFSGGSGFGYCPQNYQTFAIGTADNPASDAEYHAALAAALLASQSAPAASPSVQPASSVPTPATATQAPSTGIPTWLLVAGAVGIGLLAFSGS